MNVKTNLPLAMLLAIAIVAAPANAEDAGNFVSQTLSDNAKPSVTGEQLHRALFNSEQSTEGELMSNEEVSRGIGTSVYKKAGPAVVVVRTNGGHGTGFLIDKEGWIITNHHVVAGAPLNLQTGGALAYIHFGRFSEGLMNVDEQTYAANIHAMDENRDLALLKLINPPDYLSDIEPIAIAETNAVPGDDCIAIGHPTRGMLWTLRTGEVTGVGTWPQEQIDEVIATLAAAGTKEAQAQKLAAGMPSRKVILSTCGINPGDSGGPLLNQDGELIAVTFGIPAGGQDQHISLDKFSYHVHADELSKFIENRPTEPLIIVPSPWPQAKVSELADIDNDGHWDKWMFAMEPGTSLTGLMFDLDQNTQAAFKESYAFDKQRRELWDYEFVLQLKPLARTFYDTDNDGSIDLILTDVEDDGQVDLVITNTETGWKRIEMGKLSLFEPSLFKDEALGQRMLTIMK